MSAVHLPWQIEQEGPHFGKQAGADVRVGDLGDGLEKRPQAGLAVCCGGKRIIGRSVGGDPGGKGQPADGAEPGRAGQLFQLRAHGAEHLGGVFQQQGAQVCDTAAAAGVGFLDHFDQQLEAVFPGRCGQSVQRRPQVFQFHVLAAQDRSINRLRFFHPQQVTDTGVLQGVGLCGGGEFFAGIDGVPDHSQDMNVFAGVPQHGSQFRIGGPGGDLEDDFGSDRAFKGDGRLPRFGANQG